MTYTTNIPVTGDTLGGTRDRIRTNFQLINTVMAVNHVTFNESGAGKHKFLQMPEQVSAPTVSANEAGFYCKVGADPAESNLFFRAENNGFEYQLTRSKSINTAVFANNTGYVAGQVGGWTFLPGGMFLQYGRAVTGVGGTLTVQLPTTYTNVVYSVQCTPNVSSFAAYIAVESVDVDKFTVRTFNSSGTSWANIPFYWYAIGV